MVPFKDTNPRAGANGFYKAFVRGCRGPHQVLEGQSDYGMYPFKSADGIHWTLMTDKPVITKGRFDSQNPTVCSCCTRWKYEGYDDDVST